MNARYRKLYPRIWQHTVFGQLSREAQVAALYCLTGPQSNRIGYYRLATSTAADEIGMDRKGFERALGGVLEGFGWAFDPLARVLFIPSWWKFNPCESANNLKGVVKDFYEVPPSSLASAFSAKLLNEYRRLGMSRPDEFVALANPLPTPPEPLSNPSRTQEPDPEPDPKQEPDPEPEPNARGTARVVGRPEGGFDAFWAAYPRKAGKGEATKVWTTMKPSADLQATILEAIHAQRSSRQWLKDGGQFIPHPATWLRQQRWNDEPELFNGHTDVTSHNLAVRDLFLQQQAERRGTHD